MKLTKKVDDGNKQSSVSVDTSIPPTTAVTSSRTNMSNKELINKIQAIFEAFYINTQDPYLAAVMENLCNVWSLD